MGEQHARADEVELAGAGLVGGPDPGDEVLPEGKGGVEAVEVRDAVQGCRVREGLERLIARPVPWPFVAGASLHRIATICQQRF